MEERNYVAIVLREANTFLNGNEPAVRAAVADEGWTLELDDLLERQLQEVLIGAEHLEDIVKFSDLKEPDPVFWRDATDWQGVLAGVAAAALAHDVRRRVHDLIDGKLPRMDNIQTR